MAEGFLQGIEIANSLFAPMQRKKLARQELEQQKALMQMKVDFEKQQRQEEWDSQNQRNQELIKQFLPQPSNNANQIPQTNTPRQVATNPVTKRQQLATPQGLQNTGIDISQIPAFQESNFDAPNPAMYLYGEKPDISGLVKATKEYEKQKRQEEADKQILSNLSLDEQGDLVPYLGDHKEFGKQYAGKRKLNRQAETMKQLMKDQPGTENIDWATVDPIIASKMIENRNIINDRRLEAKERQQATFENQKILKEIGFENSKSLKSFAQQFKKESGGSGSKMSYSYSPTGEVIERNAKTGAIRPTGNIDGSAYGLPPFQNTTPNQKGNVNFTYVAKPRQPTGLLNSPKKK